jgi:hypothetical protein
MIESLEPDAYVLVSCHDCYRIPFSDLLLRQLLSGS